MGSKELKLLYAVLKFMVPALSKSAINLIEEIIHKDIDNDGKVGL